MSEDDSLVATVLLEVAAGHSHHQTVPVQRLFSTWPTNPLLLSLRLHQVDLPHPIMHCSPTASSATQAGTIHDAAEHHVRAAGTQEQGMMGGDEGVMLPPWAVWPLTGRSGVSLAHWSLWQWTLWALCRRWQ